LVDPLPLFQIAHRTNYHYARPVAFGPHRLMLRPRESRELRLLAFDIVTTPPSSLTWAQDVFGNALATAVFAEEANALTIDSIAKLELTSAPWPVFPIAASALNYPFGYSADERADLGALLSPQYGDTMGRLSGWAASLVRSNPTDTLALLKDLNDSVSAAVSYQAREQEGTQSPSHTLNTGCGSCRDMAILFVEAARILGFGARFVSGYIFHPNEPPGSGTTHAWAEAFVPGAGWITFDPTHRQLGGHNLIPVAVARDVPQATPVSGSYVGANNDLLRLTVAARVTQVS
jgi:transglutaminase-like putative cysteine protease